MSHIIVDLEKGAAALFHAVDDGSVSDVAALPPEATATIQRFAENLGIPAGEITPNGAGWLFDVLMHATEAISGAAGHTGADVEPPAQQPAPVGGAGGPQEPIETAPPSNEREPAPVAESQQVPPLNPGGAPEHGPADVDLPPVSTPQAGFDICPKCSGFRTVLEGGTVTVCPECRGAGEVPTQTAPVA